MQHRTTHTIEISMIRIVTTTEREADSPAPVDRDVLTTTGVTVRSTRPGRRHVAALAETRKSA